MAYDYPAFTRGHPLCDAFCDNWIAWDDDPAGVAADPTTGIFTGPANTHWQRKCWGSQSIDQGGGPLKAVALSADINLAHLSSVQDTYEDGHTVLNGAEASRGRTSRHLFHVVFGPGSRTAGWGYIGRIRNIDGDVVAIVGFNLASGTSASVGVRNFDAATTYPTLNATYVEISGSTFTFAPGDHWVVVVDVTMPDEPGGELTISAWHGTYAQALADTLDLAIDRATLATFAYPDDDVEGFGDTGAIECMVGNSAGGAGVAATPMTIGHYQTPGRGRGGVAPRTLLFDPFFSLRFSDADQDSVLVRCGPFIPGSIEGASHMRLRYGADLEDHSNNTTTSATIPISADLDDTPSGGEGALMDNRWLLEGLTSDIQVSVEVWDGDPDGAGSKLVDSADTPLGPAIVRLMPAGFPITLAFDNCFQGAARTMYSDVPDVIVAKMDELEVCNRTTGDDSGYPDPPFDSARWNDEVNFGHAGALGKFAMIMCMGYGYAELMRARPWDQLYGDHNGGGIDNCCASAKPGGERFSEVLQTQTHVDFASGHTVGEQVAQWNRVFAAQFLEGRFGDGSEDIYADGCFKRRVFGSGTQRVAVWGMDGVTNRKDVNDSDYDAASAEYWGSAQRAFFEGVSAAEDCEWVVILCNTILGHIDGREDDCHPVTYPAGVKWIRDLIDAQRARPTCKGVLWYGANGHIAFRAHNALPVFSGSAFTGEYEAASKFLHVSAGPTRNNWGTAEQYEAPESAVACIRAGFNADRSTTRRLESLGAMVTFTASGLVVRLAGRDVEGGAWTEAELSLAAASGGGGGAARNRSRSRARATSPS